MEQQLGALDAALDREHAADAMRRPLRKELADSSPGRRLRLRSLPAAILWLPRSK